MAISTDDIQLTRERGQSIEVLALLRAPNETMRRAAFLVAISVGLAPPDIANALAHLWPASEGIDEAIAALERRSVVQHADGRLHVIEAARSQLARAFFEDDSAQFVRAHELFAALEEDREADQDPYSEWFTRGRVAFYLAATQPDRAVGQFGDLFATAPSTERVACRMWISSLVLHQEPLLQDYFREVEFYRAFRSYVMGDPKGAREGFEHVVESGADDTYRAIALHLLGVLLRTRDTVRSIALLLDAIRISEHLDLFENEVMARCSLVWAYEQRGR